jgi:hypothetical protein
MAGQEFEHAKWLEDNARQDAQRAHDKNHEFAIKTNESAVNSANLALRTAVLINGGAAIALLAFIGGLVSNGKLPVGDQLVRVTSPLVYFATGVALATLAMALAYFTNYSAVSAATNMKRIWQHPFLEATPASKRWHKIYIGCIIVAVIIAFASLFAFVFGMIEVRNAISSLQ